MEYKCVITEEATVNVLKIRTKSPASELPQTLGKCFGELMAYMHDIGIGMVGAPYVAYFNMDMDNLDIEIGLPVEGKVSGKDTIKQGTIPAGKYLSTLHIGPYMAMEAAYHALTHYMDENGLEMAGVAYEYYLNDPQEVAEDSLQTRIAFMLKS